MLKQQEYKEYIFKSLKNKVATRESMLKILHFNSLFGNVFFFTTSMSVNHTNKYSQASMCVCVCVRLNQIHLKPHKQVFDLILRFQSNDQSSLLGLTGHTPVIRLVSVIICHQMPINYNFIFTT